MKTVLIVADQIKQMTFDVVKHAAFQKLQILWIAERLACSFSACSLSPFLCTGTTLASFHSSGKVPDKSDLLNSLHKDGAMISAVCFSSLAGISSGPVAFVVSSDLSTECTSASHNCKLIRNWLVWFGGRGSKSRQCYHL